MLTRSKPVHGQAEINLQYWNDDCFPLHDFNTANDTSDHILVAGDGRRVLKHGFNLIMLDRRHLHAVVDILHKTGEHPLTQASPAFISSSVDTKLVSCQLRPISPVEFATRPLLWGFATQSSLKPRKR